VRRTEKKQTVKKDGPQITLERGSLTKSQSKVMENRGFGIQRSEMTEEEVVKKETYLLSKIEKEKRRASGKCRKVD